MVICIKTGSQLLKICLPRIHLFKVVAPDRIGLRSFAPAHGARHAYFSKSVILTTLSFETLPRVAFQKAEKSGSILSKARSILQNQSRRRNRGNATQAYIKIRRGVVQRVMKYWTGFRDLMVAPERIELSHPRIHDFESKQPFAADLLSHRKCTESKNKTIT